MYDLSIKEVFIICQMIAFDILIYSKDQFSERAEHDRGVCQAPQERCKDVQTPDRDTRNRAVHGELGNVSHPVGTSHIAHQPASTGHIAHQPVSTGHAAHQPVSTGHRAYQVVASARRQTPVVSRDENTTPVIRKTKRKFPGPAGLLPKLVRLYNLFGRKFFSFISSGSQSFKNHILHMLLVSSI
jgi:hypothetical protein